MTWVNEVFFYISVVCPLFQPKFSFVQPRWCLSRTYILSREKYYLQPCWLVLSAKDFFLCTQWISDFSFNFSFTRYNDFFSVHHSYILPLDGKSQVNRNSFQSSVPICKAKQGCALAEPSGPLWLTFAPGHLESFCQAPWILQVLSTGLPSLFLRAQLC